MYCYCTGPGLLFNLKCSFYILLRKANTCFGTFVVEKRREYTHFALLNTKAVHRSRSRPQSVDWQTVGPTSCRTLDAELFWSYLSKHASLTDGLWPGTVETRHDSGRLDTGTVSCLDRLAARLRGRPGNGPIGYIPTAWPPPPPPVPMRSGSPPSPLASLPCSRSPHLPRPLPFSRRLRPQFEAYVGEPMPTVDGSDALVTGALILLLSYPSGDPLCNPNP
jgi:hypothetical protein